MSNHLDQNKLFSDLFNQAELEAVFEEKFKDSMLRGYDGLTGVHLAQHANEIFRIVAQKCALGSFRFTPYKEKLILKNRNSHPRMVSIPCIRDRVVLKQLNKFLGEIYPETRYQSKPKKVIESIIAYLRTDSIEDHWVYSGDVKTFFDSIPLDKLISTLRERVCCEEALSLIRHACLTPTLPVNTPRKNQKKYRPEIGVPQGISIAGTLASIYMLSIDKSMAQDNAVYHYSRYVDDVLIIGSITSVLAAKEKFKHQVSESGLQLHTNEKEQLKHVFEPFQYLGYLFHLPNKISVRKSSVDKFKKRVTDTFKNNKDKDLCDLIAQINFCITGFILAESNQHYGWLSYYNKITDLTLLYELDAFIKKTVKSLDEYASESPKELKSIVRAYYECTHSLSSGYIPRLSKETTIDFDFSKEMIESYPVVELEW